MQLLHLIAIAYFVATYDRKDAFQGLSIAMSASDVVTLCFPAVVLWGVYAVISHTPLCQALSSFVKALLLVAVTVGMTTLAYGVYVLYWLVQVVLHAPH